MTGAYRRDAGELRVDWSRAAVGDPQPCVHGCGGNAILRHPVTGRPCHKVCDDARAAADRAASEQRLTSRAAANRSKSGA